MARIDHPLIVYLLAIGQTYNKEINLALVAKIRSAATTEEAMEALKCFLEHSKAQGSFIWRLFSDAETINTIKRTWRDMEYFGIKYLPLPAEIKEYFREEDKK